MKPGILKHVGWAALIAAVLYAAAFWAIENRRTRKGPWEVTFTAGENGEAALFINQPSLGVCQVQLSFTNRLIPAVTPPQTLRFAKPREVPFDLPFGRCIYMDVTFLPGVVTLDLFGHEVELMPRTLVVDKREIAWRSNEVMRISSGGTDRTFNIQHSTSNAR